MDGKLLEMEEGQVVFTGSLELVSITVYMELQTR